MVYIASAPLVPAVASSALFGRALTPATPRPTPATGTSSLFGEAIPVSCIIQILSTLEFLNSPLQPSRSHGTSYDDVVARIHSSLFLALPAAIVSSITTLRFNLGSELNFRVSQPPPVEEIKAEDTMDTDEPQVPEEIPFVPLSQRQTKVVVDDLDSIVYVGRAKPKKRKRQAAGVSSNSNTPNMGTPAEAANAQEDDSTDERALVEPFDYSSVPNLLDNGHEMDAGTRLKKKQKKKKGKDKGTPLLAWLGVWKWIN
jgi:exosome complex exonuclease RRP6